MVLLPFQYRISVVRWIPWVQQILQLAPGKFPSQTEEGELFFHYLSALQTASQTKYQQIRMLWC